MKNSLSLAVLALTIISLASCKKETGFLNREAGMAKTAADPGLAATHDHFRADIDDARFMTLHQGALQQGRFSMGDGIVRGMRVAYIIGISSDNLVRVGASIRWVAGNPAPSGMPPEIDFMLIMEEPSIGIAYVQARAVLPPSGGNFGPMIYIIHGFDDMATYDGHNDYLSATEAATLLRYGTVTGFRI